MLTECALIAVDDEYKVSDKSVAGSLPNVWDASIADPDLPDLKATKRQNLVHTNPAMLQGCGRCTGGDRTGGSTRPCLPRQRKRRAEYPSSEKCFRAA